jgi:undecaprenyl-diphosphatase
MLLIATLLGIVEGLTEFIPVSSTGHLILAGHWLGFTGPKADAFEIFIQLGAILAVLSLFPARIRALASGSGKGFSGLRGLALLALTTVPGLIAGKLAHGVIKERLFNPTTVALGLFAGALLMLAAERWAARRIRQGREAGDVDGISWKQALAVGCFQCLALWPGMSRSSSTIVGGMILGLSRRAAAEYSFLAAVPIISAAVLYDLYKNWSILGTEDLGPFALGFAVSWLFAWISMRFLLRFLASHSLGVFAAYRMAVAVGVLAFWR